MSTIVWSKNDCVFCLRAKDELAKRGISFEERNIQKEWTKEQLLEAVPDAKTVPQIFLWGKYVGGYTDLMQYIEDHGMNIG
jgi:glutaredoxin